MENQVQNSISEKDNNEKDIDQSIQSNQNLNQQQDGQETIKIDKLESNQVQKISQIDEVQVQKNLKEQIQNEEQNLQLNQQIQDLDLNETQEIKKDLKKESLQEQEKDEKIREIISQNGEGEKQMIQETLAMRKEQAYNLIREWDSQRQNFLQVHQNLLEKIQSQVDKKLQLSNHYFEIFVGFLQSKSKQEAVYAGNVFPKIPDNSWTNEYVGEGFAGMNDGLLILEQQNLQRAQKSAEFAQVVNDDIVKQILEPQRTEIQEFINVNVGKIVVLSRNLQNKKQEVSKRSAKFSMCYHKQKENEKLNKAQQLMKGDYKSKCLFKKMINFLRIVEEQQETQRQLAKACVQYWINAQEKEIQRFQKMEIACEKYLEIYQQKLQSNGQLDDVKQIFDKIKTGTQGFEKIYSLDNIFTEQEVQYIQNEMKKNQNEKLTLKDVITFLEGFLISRFDERILLMKNMLVQREIATNKFQNSKIFISVDLFLHCFDIFNENEKFNILRIPSASFKLKGMKVTKTAPLQIEISPQSNNFFSKIINSGEKHKIQFLNEQELQEFIRFFENI